jgi:arylsulfatase A-like enzyme
MTDQQTHDAMSGSGNRWLRTPAMDSLAARGVTLTQAICPYPVCSPSRSSVMTGRMPHETGVEVNGLPIAAGIPSMGEIFQQAGYRTVYGGKWHLPKSFDGMTGFEKLIGGHALGAKMDAPLADACAAWLRAKPAEPFLMVASFMNPHDVCEWIRQHKGTRSQPLDANLPPAPANMGAVPDEPDAMRFHRQAGYDLMSQALGIASEWRRDDFRLYLHDYYRMVEAVDAEVGKLLGALRESGLQDNTLVLFVSDHGEGMGAHRWVQKAAFYEESVRVPFLAAGPGVPRGKRSDALASLTDILPTLCDWAGLPPPPDCRGLSLRPALEGGPLPREFQFSELRYGEASRDGRMVRTRSWKYIVFRTGERREQLFDLERDPGETTNLAAQGGQPLAELKGALREWCEKTGDRFPV